MINSIIVFIMSKSMKRQKEGNSDFFVWPRSKIMYDKEEQQTLGAGEDETSNERWFDYQSSRFIFDWLTD